MPRTPTNNRQRLTRGAQPTTATPTRVMPRTPWPSQHLLKSSQVVVGRRNRNLDILFAFTPPMRISSAAWLRTLSSPTLELAWPRTLRCATLRLDGGVGSRGFSGVSVFVRSPQGRRLRLLAPLLEHLQRMAFGVWLGMF